MKEEGDEESAWAGRFGMRERGEESLQKSALASVRLPLVPRIVRPGIRRISRKLDPAERDVEIRRR
jgi:hypothetical protein